MGQKRTYAVHLCMSALGQKRKLDPLGILSVANLVSFRAVGKRATLHRGFESLGGTPVYNTRTCHGERNDPQLETA